MNTFLNPRAFIVSAFFATLVALAPAQSAGQSEASNARAVREMNIMAKAQDLVTVDARAALRRRDFATVERLVAQSRALMGSVVEGSFFQATEIMADSYLAQGEYALVLGETREYKEPLGRLALTIAAALVGQGRMDEARAIVLRLYGAGDVPSGSTNIRSWTRFTDGIWELPMDRDRSDAALAASVWLLRGAESFRTFGPVPEALEDVERSAHLAPASAQIHFTLATQCVGTDPDRAKAELLKAVAMGNAQIRQESQPLSDRIGREIAKRDAAKKP